MKKIIRFGVYCLLMVMLLIPVTSFAGATQETAYAATTAPSVTISKKTLYADYETYKLKLKNISKSSKVTYKSSKTKVASVSKNGTITPISKGTTTISISVKQNNKTYTLKVIITVENPLIRLIAQKSAFQAGDVFDFEAELVGIEDSIVWSISDKTIATIGSSSGTFTAKTIGNATVTATAGNKSVTCKVWIGTNRLGTYSTDIICNKEKTIWINVDDYIKDEELQCEVGNKDLISYKWGKWGEDDKAELIIKSKGIGQTTLTITSTKSTDCIEIQVTSVEESARAKDSKELNAKEVYAKCGPLTVEILVKTKTGNSLGSGFFIGNGKIVTNYHVIEAAQSIEITTYDNKKFMVDKILGYDAVIDLALLSISTKSGSILPNQGNITVGEDIYALGSPLGLTGTLTAGIVSTVSRVYDNVNYIQTSASISSGNSGGPLLNAYGEVIGINTWTYVEGQNLNFAVNISELYKINTNAPVTVLEFYDIWRAEFLKAMFIGEMKEDISISSKPELCQEIPSRYSVYGSVTKSDEYDYYYFYLPEDGTFDAYLETETEEELHNVYFLLFHKGDLVKSGEESDEYISMDIYMNLPKGGYFICVCTVDEYAGNEIPYMFWIKY